MSYLRKCLQREDAQITIRRIVKPIDKANHIALKSSICINGKTAKHEPMKKPIKPKKQNAPLNHRGHS